jgi:hypothetical protein
MDQTWDCSCSNLYLGAADSGSCTCQLHVACSSYNDDLMADLLFSDPGSGVGSFGVASHERFVCCASRTTTRRKICFQRLFFFCSPVVAAGAEVCIAVEISDPEAVHDAGTEALSYALAGFALQQISTKQSR